MAKRKSKRSNKSNKKLLFLVLTLVLIACVLFLVYQIYFKPKPETYTISYNTNGGDQLDSENVNNSDSISLKTPTKEGYTFVGWYIDIDLTIEFDSTKELTENITLYAKWEKIEESADSIYENQIFDDFQIHFMMLGNDKAGDSIYIKAGDNDILIDAGSSTSSIPTLKSYINTYVTDNKLEYVILTHGDQDHVAGLTSTSSQKGILESYEIGTIIDNNLTTKSTQVYKRYITLRNNLVENGTTYFTAGDCFKNINGASSSIKLSENVTMDILYNYYYFNESSDENNYSVCTLFKYESDTDTYNFMLTGDLEKEGEEEMAKYYDGSTSVKTLPEVDLFKAGHHGSKTSSNECLLEIIKPKICVVSCCCGTDEYTENILNQFPTEDFLDRISKYTDRVYVTSTYETYTINSSGEIDTDGFKALNGNIVVSCSNLGIGLYGSNNLTKLKDTEWYNLEINGTPIRDADYWD